MSDTTFVTVTPKTAGGMIHITSLSESGKTACRKPATNWIIAIGAVSCQACKNALKAGKRKKKV